jgi:hypothetical protein
MAYVCLLFTIYSFLYLAFYLGRVQVEVRVHQFEKLRANDSEIHTIFYIPFFSRAIQYRPHSTAITNTRSRELEVTDAITHKNTKCNPNRSGYELLHWGQQLR